MGGLIPPWEKTKLGAELINFLSMNYSVFVRGLSVVALWWCLVELGLLIPIMSSQSALLNCML